jgi:hypothetical protein
MHFKGEPRDRFDLECLPKLRCIVESRTWSGHERAERAIRAVQRRMLQRRWLGDPCEEGTTLLLSDWDERQVRRVLLAEHNVDLALPDKGTSRMLSARTIDRLRWAGSNRLTAKSTVESFKRRVIAALRDERAWWKKHEEA